MRYDDEKQPEGLPGGQLHNLQKRTCVFRTFPWFLRCFLVDWCAAGEPWKRLFRARFLEAVSWQNLPEDFFTQVVCPAGLLTREEQLQLAFDDGALVLSGAPDVTPATTHTCGI